jgi:hypothetical protein
MRRLGRGWAWGIWLAQWWTLMGIVSSFLWGHGWLGTGEVIARAVIYGFFGSIVGLIIGASNASVDTGAKIGVGAGILIGLLRAAFFQDAGQLINLVFYYFTGQFIGAGITTRVQRPVR